VLVRQGKARRGKLSLFVQHNTHMVEIQFHFPWQQNKYQCLAGAEDKMISSDLLLPVQLL